MNQLFADITLLENSSEFLCSFTDTNFRLVHANHLFQKQFGIENDEWKGRSFSEVVRTFHMEKFLRANAECLNNPGKTISIEIQTTIACEENWFRWEFSAVKNQQNVVAGVRLLGTDITRQKKAEQTLLQQAILLDNISDAIISTDRNFLIKSWNLKAEMMFNLSNAKDINTSLRKIGTIVFTNDAESNLNKSVNESGSWNGDVLIIANNGTRYYMQTMVNAVKNKSGRITGFVVMGRDVTREEEIKSKFDIEQRRTKKDLVKEKKRFQSFMENAPLLAWITDARGVLCYMNTLFKNSYGYTNDHLNKRIGSIHRLSEKERALLPHQEVITNNTCIEFFHDWTDENGMVHYYKTFKFPIQDESGCFLEGGQSIEITDEILAQRALKKSNELFEYAAKATRDVIWDWNLKENTIRRTGGYQNLFGYVMTDAYEPHNYERIHPANCQEVIQNMEKALKGNDSRWQMEYKYLCADGTFKIVIDQAHIIRDKNNTAIRVIGSMQDVTEERDLQEQVLITEIKKQKDVISAVIAAQEKERNELSAELHDNVNQLLAASVLYLKTAQIQENIDGKLISRSLDYIKKAIEELRNISHNLTPSQLKMNGLCAALRVLAERLNIPNSFEVRFYTGTLNEKKINPTLQLGVYRIVQEEINNILKHANASKVTIHLQVENDILQLAVTDNGNGFDPATIKKGLGIINIYNRAENFGGTANVTASPGKGCTWQVSIPLA